MNHKIVSKPKILSREDTSILLCWDEVYEFPDDDDHGDISYVLQIEEKNVGWRTVYWGAKTKKKVDGLGVCTLYVFRLRFIIKNFTSEWMVFRAGTDCGPCPVMNMTRAVKIGSTSMVRKLASLRPLLLDLEDKEQKTPLMQVAERNDLPMTQFLLNMGANVNTRSLIGGRTPLMVALYRGHTQIAAALVDKGANLSAIDINQMSAIHYAVDSNKLKSVTFAVDIGCNINAQDSKGWTPLLRAVILNDEPEIVDYLLKSDADRSIKDYNGFNFDKHCELSDFKYVEPSEDI